MPAEESPEFKQAVEDSAKLDKQPNQDDLLQLYALFKQGKQDPPFEEVKAPSAWDFKGKAKYGAWQEIAGTKMSAEEAQQKYVKFVEECKGKYGFS